MNLPRWAAGATLAAAIVSAGGLAWVLSPGRVPAFLVAFDVVQALLSFVSAALLARGFYLLPDRAGRSWIALGSLVPLGTTFVFDTVAAIDGDVTRFALFWVLLAITGVTVLFATAWWHGHEGSRVLLGGWLAVLAAGELGLGLLGWHSVTSWVFGVAPAAAIALQASALLRLDAPPPEAAEPAATA